MMYNIGLNIGMHILFMIAIIVKSMLIEDIERILHVICFVCEERLFRLAVVVGCCQTNRTLVLVLMGFTLQGHILGIAAWGNNYHDRSCSSCLHHHLLMLLQN